MKKVFTSAFLFLALFTAQAANNTPEQLKTQATEQTRQLAQKICLNELEYIRIKNYTYEKLMAVQEITEMYSNDPEMRTKKLAAIEEEYTKSVMATLTPKQHQNYLALSTQQR